MRYNNLDAISSAYEKYDIINEVIIITGKEIQISNLSPKFKFIHLPGPYDYGKWPSLGLISRYSFALSCKNRYVFMQDDDCYFHENTFRKIYEFDRPLVGTKPTPRWFSNRIYSNKSLIKKDKEADILITRGILVDTTFLPETIKYAKIFWKDNYQNVFNGEDIFLSRAISKITGQQKFPFLWDDYVELPTYNVQLDKKINKEGSRTKICTEIYDFFENIE